MSNYPINDDDPKTPENPNIEFNRANERYVNKIDQFWSDLDASGMVQPQKAPKKPPKEPRVPKRGSCEFEGDSKWSKILEMLTEKGIVKPNTNHSHCRYCKEPNFHDVLADECFNALQILPELTDIDEKRFDKSCM